MFATHGAMPIPSEVLTVIDATGLGLFVVAGTGKAMTHGIHPSMAVLMGTIGGVGGGVSEAR